jgi:hypothetical protein
LGASNVLSDEGQIILNGGTLSTAGFSETFGTLNISANSTIALSLGNHSLNFATSDIIPWTGTLTITGWKGTPGTSGTNGKIFVGNNNTALISSQIDAISFIDNNGNPSSAMILASGEIVPQFGTFPIELLYFYGITIASYNSLHWATATEENTAYFEIERSKDAINFEKIGTITAAGNSSVTNEYLFQDNNPYRANNYYRIKLVNADASTEYTEIIVLDNMVKNPFNIYPNPLTSEFYYSFGRDDEEDVKIEIFDLTGRIVISKEITVSSGQNTLRIETTDIGN